MRTRNTTHGFTLVEVMVVIALIALLAVLSIATVSFLTKSIVRTELDRLYMTCTYLQQSAQVDGQDQYLVFDQHNHRYSFEGQTYQLPPQVVFGVLPGVKGPPSAAHHSIANPITFAHNTIIFHPDGIVQPGTVYLTDIHKKVLYALSCSVTQVSYLRRYEYDGSWKRVS
jgi:type II secretion system protein H